MCHVGDLKDKHTFFVKDQVKTIGIKVQLGFKVRSFVLLAKSPMRRSQVGSTSRAVIAPCLTLGGTDLAMCNPKKCKACT